MVSAQMTEIDEILQEFPPGVREHLRQAWDKMPEAARRPLTAALRELPGDLGRWRELMRLALSHLPMVTGDKHRVAIVGPANVGKSTLYNQLVRNAVDRAEVSAVGEDEKERAFAAARGAWSSSSTRSRGSSGRSRSSSVSSRPSSSLTSWYSTRLTSWRGFGSARGWWRRWHATWG